MFGGFVGYKAGPIDVVLTHQDSRNATDTDSTKGTLLGGNYDFGVAKAFLTFDVEKGTGTTDLRHMIVGATVPIGAGSLMVSFIQRQDQAVDNKDAEQLAIGYTYNLSKRTAFYTSYSRLNNDDKSSVKAVKAGETNSLFNLGVRNFF